MSKFIFDVDGTLTISRRAIDTEFKKFFKQFITDNKVWLVTGSDYSKTVQQLGQDICESVVTVYNCSGNDVWSKGKRVNSKSFEAPKELYDLMNSWLQVSPFPLRTGNHIEKRMGTINFSIIGRNATFEERKLYVNYDVENRERESIALQINSEFKNITATIGGEIGIDIYNTGCDKSQILEDFDKPYNDIYFFGDKCDPGGNDYPLAKLLKNVYKVKDWRETWKILS